MFIGSRHYIGANSNVGSNCKPGKARITMIYNFSNVKHPYHLIKVTGGGSTVFGWVDATDIREL